MQYDTYTLDVTLTGERCRDGILSPDGALKLCELAASQQLDAVGLKREYLLSENSVFLAADNGIEFYGFPRIGENIKVTTAQREIKGLFFIRDTVITDKNGETAAKVVSHWFLADAVTHSPKAPKSLPRWADMPNFAISQPLNVSRNVMRPDDGTLVAKYTVSPEDIDINGHTNNSRYAVFIKKALDSAELSSSQLREMFIRYSRELFLGDNAELYLKRDGDTVFVNGAANGSICFSSRVLI